MGYVLFNNFSQYGSIRDYIEVRISLMKKGDFALFTSVEAKPIYIEKWIYTSRSGEEIWIHLTYN